jgi:hypothetical protein
MCQRFALHALKSFAWFQPNLQRAFQFITFDILSQLSYVLMFSNLFENSGVSVKKEW